MTQQDKELLLKDLCARLPYEVHCCVFNLNKTIKEDNDIIYGIVGDNIVSLKSNKNECYMYYQIKPYLRPMSSMSEEEMEEYDKLFTVHLQGETYCETWEWLDFMNSHHFDYRNLIEKGLAIAVTEENNPYKK